jgi:hypothetical protein
VGTNVVAIVNRALLQMGARAQVSSIDPSDGSVEADAASVLFTPTFESLARTAHWNCLRNQATLSLLAAAIGTPENPNGTTLPLPPSPWLYAYELPSDCLAMRFLVPSLPSTGVGVPFTTINNAAATNLPNGGQIPYQVSYATDDNNNPIQIILTNQSQAQAVYTVNQPNPVIWDSLFQQAMVSALAAFLVPALNMNMQLMASSIASAERAIVAARTADGNEGTPTQDHVPDWMRARRGEGSGYGFGWNQGGYMYGGYCDMVWGG